MTNGSIWLPTFRPCDTKMDLREATHAPGFSTFTAKKDGLTATLKLFMAQTILLRISLSVCFRTLESIHSKISVIFNLAPYFQNLRLEITQMIYDIKCSGERIRQLRIQSGYLSDFQTSADYDRKWWVRFPFFAL